MQARYRHSSGYGRGSRCAAGIPRPPVYRVVIAQSAVTALLVLALLAIDQVMALSALLGGLICLLPNAWLVYKAFAYSGARSAKYIVNSFYRGETGKFLLTVCGFALVFAWVRPLHPLTLLAAFATVQTVNWFTPVILESGAGWREHDYGE